MLSSFSVAVLLLGHVLPDSTAARNLIDRRITVVENTFLAASNRAAAEVSYLAFSVSANGKLSVSSATDWERWSDW